MKFFVQIAFDVRCLTPEQFAKLIPHLADIGRQIGGWIKPQQKQQLPPDRQES